MPATSGDLDKAARVVFEIIRQSPGDEIVGKTRVFKAFYFAHLFYARANQGFLTDWPIVKMPHGPGIDRFDLIVRRLAESGAIVTDATIVGPYPSTRYRAVRPLDETVPDRAAAEAVREAVEYVDGKSGVVLSEITHEHSRAWNQAELGEEMSVYLDLLDDDEESAARAAHEAALRSLNAVWTNG